MACEAAMNEKLTNLKFLYGGAEYLEKYIKPESIERIYLNFSCPYPKKRYANHRLTNKRFLKSYEYILKKGAEIHQKTHNMNFFEYSSNSSQTMDSHLRIFLLIFITAILKAISKLNMSTDLLLRVCRYTDLKHILNKLKNMDCFIYETVLFLIYDS